MYVNTLCTARSCPSFALLQSVGVFDLQMASRSSVSAVSGSIQPEMPVAAWTEIALEAQEQLLSPILTTVRPLALEYPVLVGRDTSLSPGPPLDSDTSVNIEQTPRQDPPWIYLLEGLRGPLGKQTDVLYQK